MAGVNMRKVTAAAQRLARQRWQVASDKERSQHASKMAQARWADVKDDSDNATPDIAAAAARQFIKKGRR